MVVVPIKGKPAQPSREQQLRLEWGSILREHLDAQQWNAKAFHQALVEAGAEVSLQAVYSWIAGTSAPSPYNQAYCAHVLRAPAHRLFPLPRIAS